MNINHLLSFAPVGRSQYEFDNFVIGASVSQPRLFRQLLEEKQRLDNDIMSLQLDPTCKQYIDQCKNEVGQINTFFKAFDEDHIQAVLSEFEACEPQYWIHKLGIQAAIEILVNSKVSEELLERLMLLPTEDHAKSLRFSQKMVNHVRKTIADIELNDHQHAENSVSETTGMNEQRTASGKDVS